MWNKYLIVAAAALVSLAIGLRAAQAADEIHEGKVTAVSEGKLMVLDDRDGDNDAFIVTAATKITRNGKPAKLSEILAGDKAKVTATSQGTMLIASEIAAMAPR